MLEAMSKFFEGKIGTGRENYSVPILWLPEGFPAKMAIDQKNVFVNPYQFYHHLIEGILTASQANYDYMKPLSFYHGQVNHDQDNKALRDWVYDTSIYRLFVSMTTTYNHKGFWRVQKRNNMGFEEKGTFLKTIAILPYLKTLGINTVHLLPILSHNQDHPADRRHFHPYAIQDFRSLEPSYHDPLMEEFTTHQEFSALMEAAHRLGFRVIMDVAPSLVARDHYAIQNHPDWFYWVSCAKPDLFSPSPDRLDPEKWESLRVVDHELALSSIEEAFGITTAPAVFPWSEAGEVYEVLTPLRLFCDESDGFTAQSLDARERNLESANLSLWSEIVDAVLWMRDTFGFDGFSLSGRETIPPSLSSQIIQRCREHDPQCVFLSDETDLDYHRALKERGFDAFQGTNIDLETHLEKGVCYSFGQNLLNTLSIPLCISSVHNQVLPELPEDWGDRFILFTSVLSHFLPNVIPLILSGVELGGFIEKKKESSNCVHEPQRIKENPSPFFLKSELCQQDAIGWDEPEESFLKMMRRLGTLRKECASFLRVQNRLEGVSILSDRIVCHVYRHFSKKIGLAILGNTDFFDTQWMTIDVKTAGFSETRKKRVLKEYSWVNAMLQEEDGYLHIPLSPLEATVLLFR